MAKPRDPSTKARWAAGHKIVPDKTKYNRKNLDVMFPMGEEDTFLVQVQFKHSKGTQVTAGMEVQRDEPYLVVSTAPVLRWLAGRPWWQAQERMRDAGYKWEVID